MGRKKEMNLNGTWSHISNVLNLMKQCCNYDETVL